MSQFYGNAFSKPPQKGGPLIPEPTSPFQSGSDRKPVFSKVFRWRLPDGQTEQPASVEVAGTFTHWQKVPLMRDGSLDAWHVTLHHIQGHRTHHYVLFIDGQPTFDKNCDGMAIPHGAIEEGFAVQTPRGPRLCMLFAQTK
jgi:hypothetical protein